MINDVFKDPNEIIKKNENNKYLHYNPPKRQFGTIVKGFSYDGEILQVFNNFSSLISFKVNRYIGIHIRNKHISYNEVYC